ncbi:hypothetical protein WJX73_006484 [Symbiochloris irregularis]|uniref:Uncharacterized protein n=1 Tax=Symbiochloris irregularis TaxID=706552 RepID=A0AAW1PU73_9CHLO
MTETPPALQVRCGSCSSVINVPRPLLVQLLSVRQFSCPRCKNPQALNMEVPQVNSWLEQESLQRADAARTQGRDSSSTVQHTLGASSSRIVQSPLEAWRASLEGKAQLAARNRRDPGFSRQLPHLLHTNRQNPVHIQVAEDEGNEDTEGVDDEEGHEQGETFSDYRPSKLALGIDHPDPVVETASLAAVEPPDVTYTLHIDDVIEAGLLSGLQLESIVYACQRHEGFMPDGFRCGFFIGDGAGVGKGRTIAGLILENVRCGRKRHLWISIASDLRVDARRDLDDVGAKDVAVHPLNKLPYAALDSERVGIQEGVMFLTYASLASSSESGATRLDQLATWCGDDFDGLVVFDESHKAKNLVPESGSKPTKVGAKVLGLQMRLSKARIVYCSATGASEPRQMGYMVRLGLWGPANPSFNSFPDFMAAMGSRGMAALELVAMDMKAQGMYVCRTLSFAGTEFQMVQAQLEPEMVRMYGQAARMWGALRREFLYALEQLGGAGKVGSTSGTGGGPNGGGVQRKQSSPLWRSFWAAHQRFFRHMCMASKVPCLVRMSQDALADGKCVVIGLQSTGEARTADVVAERGEELDEFVSGPKELILKLVEDHYPLPASCRSQEASAAASGRRCQESAAGTASGRDGKRSNAASNGQQDDKASDKPPPKRRRRQANTGGAVAESTPEPSADELAEAGDPASNNDNNRSPVLANGHADPATGSSGKPWQQRNGSSKPCKGAKGKNAGAEAKEEDEGLSQAQEAMLHDLQQRKSQVKKAVQEMELPSNPLDQLIDLLGGPDAVAEMTGRKGRLIRQKASEGGSMKVRYEARNASGVKEGALMDMINVHERELFLSGDKYIAIISEAASAGISLHSDRRAQNQRRRVHLTLELPWSADKCLQQFGRSHRANQAHGPQYRLLFTPLGGERRFASAVARRLETLGALTQGDRRAGPSFSEFNYESTWGQKALKATYAAIMGESSPAVAPPCCRSNANGPARYSTRQFFARARALLLNVGIIRPAADVSAAKVTGYIAEDNAPQTVGKIVDADRADVPRFLNRLLGLDPLAQAEVFDFYQALLEDTVATARRDGAYDDGIASVSGTSVTLAESPKVISKDQGTGAATLLFRVLVDRGISWEHALSLLTEQRRAAKAEASIVPPAAAAEGAVQEAAAASRGAEGQEGDDDVIILDNRDQGGARSIDLGDTGADGFYRLKHDPGGKRPSVLLALQLAAPSAPSAASWQKDAGARFRIHRPCSGRNPRPMERTELLRRYEQIHPDTGQRLWSSAWSSSARGQSGTNAAMRWREVHLIGGLVLPVWDVVSRALKERPRQSERRLQVVRVMLTGEDARRLVGVQIPNGALQQIMAELKPLAPQPDLFVQSPQVIDLAE